MDTILKIEGKCLLLIQNLNDELSFYCDGFNVLQALHLLSELNKIYIEEMLLEIGEGASYKSWTKNDFKQIRTFSDLKKILENLPGKVFIYNLRIISEGLTISIYDNREFNIASGSFNIDELTKVIEKLVKEMFLFSDEITFDLIAKLVTNKNKYILIDDTGNILDVYDNFDDYLSKNKM